MFWGKSMADEEQKWRDAQSPMPVEGTELGNDRQVGDESMDVDVTEEEGSDDDIIAGCYSLEIDIQDVPYPRIWIRAEYIRIYDALEVHYRMPAYPLRQKPSSLPGIGKIIWVYYALRRRLAEMKPVIWYYRKTRYLFVEEGVYKVPDEFHDFEVFVWTLVDSDYSKDGVPEDLVMPLTRHFVIYCTPPNRDRWSRLHKTVHSSTFIMNPWKSKEMLRVTSMLPPGAILPESVDRVFNELGPTPRLCFDYLNSYGAIEQYRWDLQQAISNLTAGEPERLLQNSSSLTMDEVSHKICLISRQDREDVYSRTIVSPITSSIKSRLANRFRTLERGEQIRLYKYLSKFPDLRATAGIFFEAAAQGCFQDGVTLELLPMVQLLSSQHKNDPQWHTSHIFLHNATLEASRQQALQKRQFLEIPKEWPTEEYTDDLPSESSIKSDVMLSTCQICPTKRHSIPLSSRTTYSTYFSSRSVNMTLSPGSLTLFANFPVLRLWTNVVSYSFSHRISHWYAHSHGSSRC